MSDAKNGILTLPQHHWIDIEPRCPACAGGVLPIWVPLMEIRGCLFGRLHMVRPVGARLRRSLAWDDGRRMVWVHATDLTAYYRGERDGIRPIGLGCDQEEEHDGVAA